MNKRVFRAQKIAYLAVFVALSTITNIYTWLPVQSFAISFASIPAFFAGAVCGPIGGFLTGAMGDILGQIISPKGAWLPTITLASGLMGLIPGLFFKIKNLNDYLKIFLSFLTCLLVCTAFINTLTLWYVYSYSKGSGKTFWVYLWGRLPKQAAVSLINMVLTMAVYEPCKRLVFKKFLQPQTAVAQESGHDTCDRVENSDE
ncbi:MAG: folate family ECF transporter S component [Christensenellales bacterium]